jgi:hypothetical protein
MFEHTFFKQIPLFTVMASLAVMCLSGPAGVARAEVHTAIEYKLESYWDDFGPYANAAYFVTSFPEENTALEIAIKSGIFVLTGEVFYVWSGPSDGARPTCRFWSGRYSSHVFTPHEAECAKVRADSDWRYEGIAFYVHVPDENGRCASGQSVLYRLYNNGVGVPHHRLTTSVTTVDRMLAMGWVFEGDARTRAFACVPISTLSSGSD